MYLTATEEVSMLSVMGVLRHDGAGPRSVTAHPFNYHLLMECVSLLPLFQILILRLLILSWLLRVNASMVPLIEVSLKRTRSDKLELLCTEVLGAGPWRWSEWSICCLSRHLQVS